MKPLTKRRPVALRCGASPPCRSRAPSKPCSRRPQGASAIAEAIKIGTHACLLSREQRGVDCRAVHRQATNRPRASTSARAWRGWRPAPLRAPMASIPDPLRIADFRLSGWRGWPRRSRQMAMVIVIGWQVYDIARADDGHSTRRRFQLGLIGLVQFVPLFVLHPDQRLGRRPARPAPHRPRRRSRSNCSAPLILFAATWGGFDHPADPVRRRRAARRRPRLRRAGAGRAGAQPGPARNPAQRDRPELDRLAGGRDRRPGARRHPLRRHAAPALRASAPACSPSRGSACS